MTDKELLELAAKTARVALRDLDDIYDSWEECPVLIHRGWNPLTDDGDALRLAVKLGLSMDIFGATTTCVRHDFMGVTVTDLSDPCVATRRAIVRAAAEIGKIRP